MNMAFKKKQFSGWNDRPGFPAMGLGIAIQLRSTFNRFAGGKGFANPTKTPGLASGRLVKTEFRRLPELAGVKFDDELLVDERIDVGAVRDARNGDFELVLVHGEPVLDRHGLREVGHAVDQLL